MGVVSRRRGKGGSITRGIIVHTPHILEEQGGKGMQPSGKTGVLCRLGRPEEKAQLQRCMEEVRRSLNQAYTAFNMADDDDWIEPIF